MSPSRIIRNKRSRVRHVSPLQLLCHVTNCGLGIKLLSRVLLNQVAKLHEVALYSCPECGVDSFLIPDVYRVLSSMDLTNQSPRLFRQALNMKF